MLDPESSFSIIVLMLGAAVAPSEVFSGSMTRPASVPVRGVENGAVGCGRVEPLARDGLAGGCGVGTACAGALGVVGVVTVGRGAGAGVAVRGGTLGVEVGAGPVIGAEICAPGPAVTGVTGETTGAGAVLAISGVWPATGASAKTSWTVRTTSSIPTCDFTR